MNQYADTPAIPMQVSRRAVVASIQVDLDDAVLSRFRQDLLQLVKNSGLSAVIIDLSAMDILDLHEFNGLRKIMRAASIMGALPVLAGLRPGVVAALVEAGATVDDLLAARDLDAAYNLLPGGPASEAI